MIIYTDRFIPAQFDGINYGPISFIRPSFRQDMAISAHENTHQAQFWNAPFTMGLRYKFSRQARQDYEVEAYKAQLKIAPQELGKHAFDLATKYDLGLSITDAKKLLET